MAAMAPGSQKKLAISMAICAAFLASALITTATAVATKSPSPEDYVELHNAARVLAGAGPVSWDADAARHAAKRAAAGCGGAGGLLRSSSRSAAVGGRGVYGENVFRGTAGTPGKKQAWAAAAAAAMRAWTATAATEYAQVVWPGSDRVGCAHAVCAGDHGVVISCSYKPAVKEELKAAPLPSYCRYNISRCLDCPIC